MFKMIVMLMMGNGDGDTADEMSNPRMMMMTVMVVVTMPKDSERMPT